MAKSPYARKEYLRHRTDKQQRIVNRSVDIAFKSVAGKSASKKHPEQYDPDAWKRTALTAKQLCAASIVGAIMPVLALGSLQKGGFSGTFLLVEFFFFAIPFFVMVLIFMLFNSISRASVLQGQEDQSEDENAERLTPQLEKQINECETLIHSTTSPQVFFERYDFCVEQLKNLQSLESHTTIDVESKLHQMESLSQKDIEVMELLQRVKEKYCAKIDSLKTAKAKRNWATRFHQEFEPYVSRMSDITKSKLGEYSAELCVLAGMDGE